MELGGLRFRGVLLGVWGGEADSERLVFLRGVTVTHGLGLVWAGITCSSAVGLIKRLALLRGMVST